jgi:mannose-6-phosphate isomerase-like protein (cupin superfamily)
MNRKDFLTQTGVLSAMGLIPFTASSEATHAPFSDPLKPLLLPSQPPLEHKGGLAIRTWVRSSMTNGLYSSVECAVASKVMGPPPHYHKELDELMYVVEGTASILIGDDIVEVKAGGWHLRPRMLKHTFWNATEQSLRFIDMYFNQPFEEYLEKIFFELTPEKGYSEGSPAKMKALTDLNEKFGLVFEKDAFSQMDAIKKEYKLH